MAGKHHKRSRIQSTVARVAVPGGLAAAAVTATSLSTAFVTGTAPAVAPAVELMALITPANSTAQVVAGSTYYGTDYTKPPASTVYGKPQVVPFFLGPEGIANAISDADDNDGPNRTAVLASGWGAGQTGEALGQLPEGDLDDIDIVILDNNTNRAGGGFWTMYHPFASLLLTTDEPTPDDLDVPILDVGYGYNINGNAPTDPLNLFSLGNSLAAYAYGYGGEQTAVIPQEAIDNAKAGPDAQHYHYIVDENGNPALDGNDVPIAPIKVDGNITYVTVKPSELPLLRPLRLLPGGDILAEALEPTVTELVDAGYEGGEAIPAHPEVRRKMQPFSSINNLGEVPDSVQIGLTRGQDEAQAHLGEPTKFVTEPVDELGNLPVLGSLTSSISPTNTFNRTGGNNVFTGLNKPDTTSSPSSRGTNPGQRFADRLNEAVNKLAGGLYKNEPADEND